MMIYTPKQMAECIKVSTTTLRRYEEQDLIPVVPRTNSNHRYYTQIHLQAFVTIRSLLQCYEIPVVYEVMRKVKNHNIDDAFWLINEQQYAIEREKKRIVESLKMIKNNHIKNYEKVKNYMSIGEVAKIAEVNTSAIRHWEKEGLIFSERDKNNGYRMFTVNELRKILIISSLRKSVYAIDKIRELLQKLDTQNIKELDHSLSLALNNLNQKLLKQFTAISELTQYVDLINQN